MVVNNLYYGPYLRFVIERGINNVPSTCKYSDINWRNEWYAFFNLAKKDRNGDINKILAWFDKNVLQAMDIQYYPEPKLKTSITTLDVRIRIVCGMINKISHYTLSREMKIAFMECIWDTYKKFKRLYLNSYFIYAEQLPF